MIENHRDYRGSNLFNKAKAIERYVKFHIVHGESHSSALKTILSFDYRNYLKTRL